MCHHTYTATQSLAGSTINIEFHTTVKHARIVFSRVE